jgi:hypothetical protein
MFISGGTVGKMDGEALYLSGRVLWVVKSGGELHAKVLDDYPYYVRIDLKTGENICTCPSGGNCEHVEAVKLAYERGFYFDCPDVGEFPEACALSMLNEVPKLGLEVTLKELRHALETDESGSTAAMLLLRGIDLVERTKSWRKIPVLEDAMEEYSALFPDYDLTERLKSRIKLLLNKRSGEER